jgi:hypothetical protein
MPNSPAADITKALRHAVKEEDILQVRKILIDPQLLYITYNSAFAAPLEKAVKKGNMTLVQIIVKAIQERYQKDAGPDAAAVINKVIQLETTPSHPAILKKLYEARASIPVHQKCDLTALRNAVKGGQQEAIQVILDANAQTPLPGDQLLEDAVEVAIKNTLLSSGALVISPGAREAALAVVASPPPATVQPATHSKPATIAAEAPMTTTQSLSQHAADLSPDSKKLAELMQMMQAMLGSPELSSGRIPASTSGVISPATPVFNPL